VLSRGIWSDSSSTLLEDKGKGSLPPLHPESYGSSDNQATPTPTPRKKHAQRESGENLTRDHDGCNYKGTFPRQWELKRRIAAKHTKEKPFWCPVIGCIKGSGAPAFARPDKLTAHIRAVHYGKGVRAVCSASTCADTAVDLDLLGVHVKFQHLKYRQGGGMFRGIVNAASTDHRYCPLWFWKVRVSLQDFPSHLLGHASEELVAALPELAQAGYMVCKFGCRHGEGDAGSTNGWCVCEVTSIEVMCPICASRQEGRQSLQAHIQGAHAGLGQETIDFRQRCLALVGVEAMPMLGGSVWSDILCQL
jgi:hypothetical protein